MKPAGDHQMKNQKQLVFERENDPLADAFKADNPLTFCGTDRRLEGAQEERIAETNFLIENERAWM
jgi:hypothetical protein